MGRQYRDRAFRVLAMRVPRLQFSVRRMMIAVALAALLSGGEATRRRWVSLASSYRLRAAHFQSKAVQSARGGGEADLLKVLDKERLKLIADHFYALARKYEQAAHFPWLRLGPDPPEPE